jgi:exopolysaccharide production protein ExoQ
MIAPAAPKRSVIGAGLAVDRLLPPLFGILGPLVYIAPLGVVAWLLVTTLAATIVCYRHRAVRLPALLADFVPFLPLLGWMVLSVVWALDPRAAVSLALRLTGLFVAGLTLTHGLRRLPVPLADSVLSALAWGFLAADGLVLLDLVLLGGRMAQLLHVVHGDHYDLALFYGRGATIQAMLIVPLLLGLWRCRVRLLATAQLAAGIAAILVTSSLSAKLALATALIAGSAVAALPILRLALPALLALGAAILPLLLPYSPDPLTTCWLSNEKPSALHRLYIWNFAAERIADRPIAGWGLDAARRIPGGDFPVVIRGCDAEQRPTKRVAVNGTLMPLHPHNAILQVWLELGGIGVVLGAGAVLFILIRGITGAYWRGRAAQAGFAASAGGASVVALISFGIWQEWFLSVLFLAAAIAMLAARRSDEVPAPPIERDAISGA